jgi:hypothetical protein
MVLLAPKQDVDPGFSDLMTHFAIQKKRSTEGIRQWARHFAPIDSSSSIQVSFVWEDFFIASLLNPLRFDWAKNFLSLEAWSVILNDSEGDTSPFSLPQKCPSKRKLGCVISEIAEDGKVEQSNVQEEPSEMQRSSIFQKL